MSEEKKIKTVQTPHGELRYYRDWDNSEGGVVMLNPRTLDRYREIRDGHPKIENYGCFFAFGQEQFDRNLAAAVLSGRIKESDQIVYHPHYSGLYGTTKGVSEFLNWYHERDKAIPVECDPQEVYFYEYNNHECMFGWDGDKPAFDLIVAYFGEEVASKIVRL